MLTKDELRAIDVRVHQEVFGIPVVALDWPCGYPPDGCSYEADYQKEPGRFGRCSWYTDLGPVYAVNERGWPPDHKGEANVEPVPFYSTDIREAWTVLKKAWDDGVVIMLSDTGRWAVTGDGTWPVQDGVHDPGGWMAMFQPEDWQETVELAICMATLRQYEHRAESDEAGAEE